MATKKEIRGVIVPRHDTAINWSKAVNFTPENGELIIISADNATDVARGYYLDSEGNKLTSITVNSNGVNKVCTIKPSDKVRFKFGNGKDNVNALPFQTDALQDTASGSTILIDDISPIPHEMIVKVRGISSYDVTLESGIYTNENLSIDATGSTKFKSFKINLPVGTYTLASDVSLMIVRKIVDGVYSNIAITGKTLTFSVTAEGYVGFSFRRLDEADWNNVDNVWINEGTTAIPYTPYIPDLTAVKVIKLNGSDEIVAEYTPTADGTVNGVTSLYPNTTLTTDTNGILIDCEYLTNNYKYVLDNRIPKQVQADWNQNDETANDYIKNRPGGYEGLTEILPETTLNFTSGSLTLTDCPPIEVGKQYIVTFYHPNSDNTEYKLVGKNDSSGFDYACIGNESYDWGGGTDTTTPFLIYNLNNSSSAPTIYISSSEIPCTYNIKIKAIAPVKIDEKYLDIKNTNIVDGSEKGSLRTVGSAEERSGYKIGTFAFAEGFHTTASGDYSHAEGGVTQASGSYSHAEGSSTTASEGCSHAEGYYTTASGYYSHAEGDSTTASEGCSHAEGYYTTASGYSSHAEGGVTQASGSYSHAEGGVTQASGDYSHAEGNSTKALGDYSHVQGKYNIEDSSDTYADIIGNGSSDTKRSNAATVDWDGNAWYAGDVYVGSTSGKNKDEGSKKLATEEYIDKKIEVSDTAPIEEENKIWLKPIADSSEYIIEEGTNGIWTYRIWNSGISECWGKKAISVTTSTSNNGYYTGNVGSLQYPSNLFISAPVLNCTLKASRFPGHLFIDDDGTPNSTENSSYTGTISIAAHSNTTVNGYIHLSAKGRWK